jgi:hypothetical protein
VDLVEDDAAGFRQPEEVKRGRCNQQTEQESSRVGSIHVAGERIGVSIPATGGKEVPVAAAHAQLSGSVSHMKKAGGDGIVAISVDGERVAEGIDGLQLTPADS